MIKLLQWFTRIAGLGALVLGMLIYFDPGIVGGFAPSLQLHMALGGIVALVLAVLAILALSACARVPAAVAALVWAAATVYVGMRQESWLPGGSHWVIEIIHVLLGIGAIGLAEMLAGAVARKRASLA